MLPLLNLTSSEFISPDTLQRAGRLVPDGLHTLQGGFASVLQSEVVPAVLRQAPAGEVLPATGNALPGTLSGHTLQLEAALDAPPELALELSIDELDLSPMAGESLTGRDTGPALPIMLDESAREPGDPVPADDGLPVALHVPPGPGATVIADPAIPVVANDTAGGGIADALPVPLMATASNTEDRGSRLQARDRAVDTAALRQQVMARASVRSPAHTVATIDSGLNPRSQPLAGSDDSTAELLQRPGSGTDAPAANRAVPELALSRDDSTRAIRDDGLPIPRPLQPAPWQQGTAATEVVAESGQRIHADVAAAMPRAPTAQALPPLPTVGQSIGIPVQQPGWDNVLADRVTMMANGRLQNAELRLTPAELGPLRIQLEIDDGVANVSFQSQHPVTREALEQAMPRLRELLAENGLSLGQADVRDDSSQQRSRGALADARAASAAGADGGEFDETPASRATQRVSDSLVDTFA